MAKWGEGDPRWIVEERPDATNVNNWHWTEKNAGPWSQDRLKELFKNQVIPSAVGDLKIIEVEKCEGEASANNRKGKLIFFYEWNITLKWCGTLKDGSGIKHEGKINIPNMSEENDVKEVEITVTLKDSTDEGEVLKSVMHTAGKDIVRKQLSQYLKELKEEFSKGLILPKKGEECSTPNDNKIQNLASGFNKKMSMEASQVDDKKTKSVGLKIDTATIRQTNKFQCKAQEFYDAMTRVEMVTAFTQGPAQVEANRGGKFSLFGGNVTGEFEELVPASRIVQRWRLKQWPAEHYSTVTLSIEEKSDHTEVNLVQTGVPASESEVTKINWNRYYWDAMKKTFGFGAFFT